MKGEQEPLTKKEFCETVWMLVMLVNLGIMMVCPGLRKILDRGSLICSF